ncbi:MAG: hypothetical protein KAR32_05565, partial [Candidatus Omnitrophica bacterium]|nr:hypothetical protein [Candidatus Omnitrophota bacterium]
MERAAGEFFWEDITANLSNTTEDQQAAVKVEDKIDDETYGISQLIEIQSVFNVTNPEQETPKIIVASGEQDYSIEWSTTGWEVGDQVYVKYKIGTGSWTNCERDGEDDSQPYDNESSPNSFPWDVLSESSVISESVLIRVVDAGDSSNFNESEYVFAIRAGLNVKSPIGNAVPADAEEWLVGSTHKITWSLVGYMATVKMQVSTDGGAFADIPADGQITAPTGIPADEGDPGDDASYGWVWTIPDSISKQVKIQVVNEADPTKVFAPSPNYFNIIGQIDFNPTLPVGGDEIWYVGETKAIAWTNTGDIPTIKLQYSTDGSNYIDITNAESLTSDESPFIWTVDNLIDPDINICAINTVVDGTKPTTPAVSGNVEVKGQLKIDAPVASDLWQVDNTYNVLWTPTGTMSDVRLEFSTDAFVGEFETWYIDDPAGDPADNLDAGDTGVQQSFVWKIPNNINNTVTVRVTDNDDDDVIGQVLMKIVGGFKLKTPNGTDLTCSDGGVANQKECYEVDGQMTISWDRHGSITNAKLQYSTDNFVGSNESNSFADTSETWTIETVLANTLSYGWDPVFDRISETVKVRIVDADFNNTTVFTLADISDSNSAIRGRIDTLTLDGEPIVTGSTVVLIDDDVTVAWVKHGNVPFVKVEYKSTGHDADYVPMLNDPAIGGNANSVGDSNFAWRIPDKKSLDGVTFKITNLSDTDDVITISNAFTIRGGFEWSSQNVTVAGTVFKAGDVVPITWNTFGTIDNISIKYSTNNDGTFTVAEPNWVFVKDDIGNDADNIINGEPGTLNWKVPTNIASQDVYLVVYDPSDANNVQQVSVKVKIAGVINVDEPDNYNEDTFQVETDRWGVAANKFIRWTLTGPVNNVRVQYTTDITAETPVWIKPTSSGCSDTGYVEIVGSLKEYPWQNIPACALSTKAAIRIYDAISDSGTDIANSPQFSIVGSFAISSPAADEVLRTTGTDEWLIIGTSDIEWTTEGSISQVNLYYSTNGGAPDDCSTGDWTLINTGGSINNAISYSWTVPPAFSDNVVVRIRDSVDGLTCNDSEIFTIRGDIKLTEPNGDNIWGVGQNQDIIWDVVGIQGSPNDVFIEFKKGVGSDWYPIRESPLEHTNDGSVQWNVPETEVHSEVYLRIYNTVESTDSRYIDPEVISAAPFKLVRRYQISSLHSGGDIHVAGKDENITWNKWGTVVGDATNGYGNVYIDFAKDGETYDDEDGPISSISEGSTPNNGSFAWTPTADDVTPSAKIRIADTVDTEYESPETSASNFIVRGVLTLSAIPATVKIGDVYQLRWTRISNVDDVVLTYSNTTNFSTNSNFIEDSAGDT